MKVVQGGFGVFFLGCSLAYLGDLHVIKPVSQGVIELAC
jgi:hypothetical protein